MTTYFITWGAVALLVMVAKQTDFQFGEELSFSKVRHTTTARIFFFLACAVLVFVGGCRFFIGSDYFAYYGWYKDYASSFFERLREFDEPGLSFVFWLTTKVWNDGFACIFVVAAITILLVLKVLRDNTDNIAVGVILYALICWTGTFNGLRQALAVAIFFCGFPYLRDKKIIKFGIIVFLAFLCHKSALVMALLYFVVHRKTDAKNIIILAIASVAVIYSYDRVFDFTNELLDKEINTEGEYISRSVNLLRVAANMAPGIYFVAMNWKKEADEKSNFYLNLLIIHGLIALITLNSAYLARLNMYTAPFVVISICELVKREKENRTITEIIVIILYFAFELYEVYNSVDLSPFKWIWER